MAECVCLSKCLFFNDKMSAMPTTAERMKKRYCLGESAGCARYIVFSALGREKVPTDLFPHNVERAQALLAVA